MSEDEVVYQATHTVNLRRSVAELFVHREVVWSFASRAMRIRYKQVALGVAWGVLQPLAYLVIFTIVFGRFADVGGGGAPYAVAALAALVGWQLVSGILSFGAPAVVGEGAVMRKVFFPREGPVLGAVLASLADSGINLALFFLLSPFLGGHFGVALVSVPLLLAVITIAVLGVTLPLAAANVYYRDVRFALPLVTQLWLFASPVAYPLSQVPHRWRTLYLAANPLAAPIDGLRRSLALATWPDWGALGVSALESIALLVIGYRIFKMSESEFADVV